MKETDILKIIQDTIKSKYIGDDCAYLEDLNIVVTQDSLVEDVHFAMEYTTPFQLGYKSAAVNLSDIYASGAEAKYLTISLSLPKNIDENFIKEFYEGASSISKSVQIVGGDITGADKIYISICAIGSTQGRKISSRKNAKIGYKIITNGFHGSSSGGLYVLQNKINGFETLKKEHLMPTISNKLSDEIAKKCNSDYAMMDSSDGLADAIYKISKMSGVSALLDFKKIPFDKSLKNINNIDYKNMIFFGGEDYKIVCAISEKDLEKIDNDLYTVIGEIIPKKDDDIIKIDFDGITKGLKEFEIEEKVFNHFK
jgi:thiamine-monophosphate kinase